MANVLISSDGKLVLTEAPRLSPNGTPDVDDFFDVKYDVGGLFMPLQVRIPYICRAHMEQELEMTSAEIDDRFLKTVNSYLRLQLSIVAIGDQTGVIEIPSHVIFEGLPLKRNKGNGEGKV